MRGNLGVIINDGGTRQGTVTRKVSGLKFKRVAQGGDHSASCTLTAPLADWTNLGPADQMHIDDTSTGERIWSGYTEDPVRTSRGGQSIDISAGGGMVRAQDENRGLIYIDRDSSNWARTIKSAGTQPQSANTSWTVKPPGTTVPALIGAMVGFSPGQPIGTFYVAEIGYDFAGTDMEFGAIAGTAISGKADAGWFNQLSWWSGPGGVGFGFGTIAFAITTATSAILNYANSAGSPSVGTKILGLSIVRGGGATNVADDDTWTHFSDLRVLGRRMDRFGVLVSGAGGMNSAQYVLPHQVAEDIAGRLLINFCDPNTVYIEGTPTQIDQLAFREGATAAGVLDAMSLWEPDYLWSIGPQQVNGLHPFAYRTWPYVTRYELGSDDDVNLSAGETTLCNRVQVYWSTPSGERTSLTVTSTVPELGTRIKDAPAITLPEGKGSAANAQRIGEQVLASMALGTRGGTATVRRRIYDNLLGRTVDPWHLQPGHLATSRETGETLRVTEMEYDDDSCSTRLTLGSPTLSIEQRIAKLGSGLAAVPGATG